VKEVTMKSRLLAAFTIAVLVSGCATGGLGLSPSGTPSSGAAPPPSGVDRDCNAIQPRHTPACERVRAQVADLEDQIQGLQRSLEGPPRPTGSERSDIMRHISDLERQKGALHAQVAACDGGNVPRRQPSGDVRAFLTNSDPAGPPALATLVVAPAGTDLPPDGKLTQPLTGQELVFNFTGGGCSVRVVLVPVGRFKTTGFPRDFSLGVPPPGQPSFDANASRGSFHPVTGQLDLHIETWFKADISDPDPVKLDLTTHPPATSGPSGRNVDASGNVKLVMQMPLSLDPNGNVAQATGVRTVSFTFEGKLSARPAP
jgi:hypothetical protein